MAPAATSRLATVFAELRRRGERALVAYLTAGDPSLADTRRLLREAAPRGADIVELGGAFSGPLADRPPLPRPAMRAPPPRVRLIARRSRGFIYVVSLTGVTGERRESPRALAAQIRTLRRLTTKPVCVGFGIANPDQVAAVGRLADGVIVGSAIVRLIEERAESPTLVQDVGDFIAALKEPLRVRL